MFLLTYKSGIVGLGEATQLCYGVKNHLIGEMPSTLISAAPWDRAAAGASNTEAFLPCLGL